MFEFPGKHMLVAALDNAVSTTPPGGVAHAVAAALQRLHADPRIQLPPALAAHDSGPYLRRELHESSALAYSVVAMTWPPGQGTPIHDHDGAWCAEIVWQGRLCIDDYVPVAQANNHWRFKPTGRTTLATGQCGRLQPPDEYHAVHNPDPDRVAVSIHVYQRRLDRCQVFVADPAAPRGWLRSQERRLGSDASVA